LAERTSSILERLEVERGTYLLVTAHRAENTDDPARLREILKALLDVEKPVVFPVHPRTRKALERDGVSAGAGPARNGLQLLDPVSYLDMLVLERHAAAILTDSGGVQKEAFAFDVPCITLRRETEWVETVESGFNVLTGTDPDAILRALRSLRLPDAKPNVFGEGVTASLVVAQLESFGHRGVWART
jgi:UDP-N-acetylglucosamine 2-epimerase